MADEKYVVVPQRDLDAVREARDALYKLLPTDDIPIETVTQLQTITAAFWKVGNTRYPVTHNPE